MYTFPTSSIMTSTIPMTKARLIPTFSTAALSVMVNMKLFQQSNMSKATLMYSRIIYPLKKLMFELDALETDLDREGHGLLTDLKRLVDSKNRLDFKFAHETALRIWLFVHVPATYALVVLSLLHALTAYAYRSGVD